jgi:hypothetical protein
MDRVFASNDIGQGASLLSGLSGGFVFSHCVCRSEHWHLRGMMIDAHLMVLGG